MKCPSNKCISFLHIISTITAVLGTIAIIAMWVIGENETFLGMTQAHLFSDAMILFLASIAFGVGTLVHQNMRCGSNEDSTCKNNTCKI